MVFTKKTWKDRVTEFPTRRTLTKSNNTTELVTVERTEGTVSEEGDAFSAATMNDLETRIAEPWAGCWIAFEDKDGNATTKPYIHWLTEE